MPVELPDETTTLPPTLPAAPAKTLILPPAAPADAPTRTSTLPAAADELLVAYFRMLAGKRSTQLEALAAEGRQLDLEDAR